VLDVDPGKPLFRMMLALLGCMFLGWGGAALKYSPLVSYRAVAGGPMFAPFAILLGLFILCGAIFSPRILK